MTSFLVWSYENVEDVLAYTAFAERCVKDAPVSVDHCARWVNIACRTSATLTLSVISICATLARNCILILGVQQSPGWRYPCSPLLARVGIFSLGVQQS